MFRLACRLRRNGIASLSIKPVSQPVSQEETGHDDAGAPACDPAYAARSFVSDPDWPAQRAQQKIWPRASTLWATMRTPQCVQRGAIPSIAHSKLSKVMLRSPWVTMIAS
jgi:hypothetical protein